MSELQIGLMALGVVLLLGVLAYNWWQDRRVRRQMQEQFPQTDEDPLLGGLPPAGASRKEPGLATILASAADTAVAGPDAFSDDPADEVDAVCEAVIDIVFTLPVPANQLADALSTLLPGSGKPVRYFCELPSGRHYAGLPAGESCCSLQIAVLMANRNGALTAIEWSTLWTAAQSLAERFDGAVEGPEQDEVVQQAQVLDTLCAGLDAQVGLALQLSQPRSADTLRDTLTDAGFARVGQNMAWVAETGAARFTLLFDGQAVPEAGGASVSRLDFLLDLPNTPADSQAFSRMASVGRDLAQRLDAFLVDDQGRPVTNGSDATIDKQLAAMYDQLVQAGFEPGSVRASRLFS